MVALWRRKVMWIPLAVCAALGLAASVVVAQSNQPGYEASGTAFVTFSFPKSERDPFSGSQFVTQRIESYAQLGTSTEVLRAVADDVGDRTASDLDANVEVSSVPGTVMLRVVARDPDETTSLQIANSVMAHLEDAVTSVERGASARSPINLVPVQPAVVRPASTLRSDVLTATAGLAVGLVVGTLVGALAAAVLSWRRAGGRRSRRAGRSRFVESRQEQPPIASPEPADDEMRPGQTLRAP